MMKDNNDDLIELYAIRAKNDKSSYDLLAELLYPDMKKICGYFCHYYKGLDESTVMYQLNNVLNYCVENYDNKEGKFIFFWRFIAKKTMARFMSKWVAKRNNELNYLESVKFDPTFEIANNEYISEDSLFLKQAMMDFGKDSPSMMSKTIALLWSIGLSPKDIAPIFGLTPLGVRRSIKKVLAFIQKKREEYKDMSNKS